MKITPKPQETIDAQLAAFASSRFNISDMHESASMGYLLNNLGQIALEHPDTLTRTTRGAEYRPNEDGSQTRLSKGEEVTVATKGEFLDFLRTEGGSTSEGIKNRSDMLKSYNDFQPEVRRVFEELKDPKSRKEHSAYLGSGTNAFVFTVDHSGRKYAVRRVGGGSPSALEGYVAGAAKCRGVPHFEQIVAASYEDGVTVAEIMPGKEIDQLSLDDIKKISDGQLNEMIDSLALSVENGIRIDPKQSNIFYDQETGFGFIDYDIAHSAVTKGQVIGEMAAMLAVGGQDIDAPFKGGQTIQGYAEKLDLHVANLGVVTRYKRAVEQRLAGTDLGQALEMIEPRISMLESTIKNFSDANWVENQLS